MLWSRWRRERAWCDAMRPWFTVWLLPRCAAAVMRKIFFQEVFLRYFRSAPVFSEEEHRRAWLIRVTVNCAKKFWTSAWMRRTVPLEEAEGLFQETEDTLLWEQLQLLPGKYRAVLHLFYYEQLSVGEIGKLLGEKPATVRTQLTRARRLLRKQLKEEE